VSEERARIRNSPILVALLALCGAGLTQAQDSGDAKVEELEQNCALSTGFGVRAK